MQMLVKEEGNKSQTSKRYKIREVPLYSSIQNMLELCFFVVSWVSTDVRKASWWQNKLVHGVIVVWGNWHIVMNKMMMKIDQKELLELDTGITWWMVHLDHNVVVEGEPVDTACSVQLPSGIGAMTLVRVNHISRGRVFHEERVLTAVFRSIAVSSSKINVE
ncbi:hypothetical protein Tco_0878262 [Tanacetum coccineum]|uniref:Uncharacterized protein n=1 Tax=Tanacetum coccineum TaxID=301880 RepID=A0ABQ5BXU6_9ASTR